MLYSFTQVDDILSQDEYTLTEIIDIAKELADFDYSTQTIEGNKLHKRMRAKLARELDKLEKSNPQSFIIRRPNRYTTLYSKDMVRELFNHPYFANYINQIKYEASILEEISKSDSELSSTLMQMVDTLIKQQTQLISQMSQLTEAIKASGFPINAKQYKAFMERYSEIEVKVYAILDALREFRFPVEEFSRTPWEIRESAKYKMAKRDILSFLNS